MIGLAVMGSNLARNIESRGIPVAVFNRSGDVTKEFMKKFGTRDGKTAGFVASSSLQEFVQSMESPRQIFIMIKAGASTDAVIDQLAPLLDKGDIVIDGGNAFFKDTIRREEKLTAMGLNFLGIGISGGEEGALKGPSLMPGGPKDAWKIVAPMLEKIAAQADGACTNYVGPNGAGHFVKMVHNGIEYGIMAAYAEGLAVLKAADVGTRKTEVDAETTPLRQPELYQYKLNITDVAEVWRRGSVIASWLLDLSAAALTHDPALAEFQGRVSDSGEGRWTIKAAIDEGVPVPVLSAALYERFYSRGQADYADRLLSAMRYEFGGHLEKKA